MISVLIPTLNEARNIVECLKTVRWADEVVVVDSVSTDGTQALASQLGAKIIDFKWNGRLPKKKNWALENIPWRNEWVLILDADERVTSGLAAEITAALKHPTADGYFLNRRFLFMGKWIRHCGYYPSWNLRLFRHDKGRYETLIEGDTHSGDNEVHEHVLVNGRTDFLRHEMLHLAYPDIFTFVEKHNRYSSWEAHIETSTNHLCCSLRDIGQPLALKRRLKLLSRRLPLRPILRFFYAYFLQRGFLDGYQGYVLCRLLATYEMLSAIKARELRLKRVSACPTK
jgi:glycosyltransferase involved in cell wall biosynthesis